MTFRGSYKNTCRKRSAIASPNELCRLKPFTRRQLIAVVPATTRVKMTSSGIPCHSSLVADVGRTETTRVRPAGVGLEGATQGAFNWDRIKALTAQHSNLWKGCDGFSLVKKSSKDDFLDSEASYVLDRTQCEFGSNRPISLGLYGPLVKSRKCTN